MSGEVCALKKVFSVSTTIPSSPCLLQFVAASLQIDSVQWCYCCRLSESHDVMMIVWRSRRASTMSKGSLWALLFQWLLNLVRLKGDPSFSLFSDSSIISLACVLFIVALCWQLFSMSHASSWRLLFMCVCVLLQQKVSWHWLCFPVNMLPTSASMLIISLAFSKQWWCSLMVWSLLCSLFHQAMFE